MNLRRKLIGLAVAVLASTAIVGGTAAMANGQEPGVSASCSGVHLTGSGYDGNQANKYIVTIGVNTAIGTFGASLDKTFPVPQGGASTTWSGTVEAYNGEYKSSQSGTVGPCGQLPQPPNDVSTFDKTVDTCDLGGYQTTHTTITITYMWNQTTGDWEPGSPVVTTQTDPVVPYTVRQSVEKGCTEKPTEPERVVTEETQKSCAAGVEVRLITTRYVYDEDTNTWVLGAPSTGPWYFERDLTADEATQYNCTKEPIIEPVTKSDEGCDIGGYEDWSGTVTTTYAYNPETFGYDATVGDAVWGEPVLTPYTKAERIEAGCVTTVVTHAPPTPKTVFLRASSGVLPNTGGSSLTLGLLGAGLLMGGAVIAMASYRRS